MLRPERSVSTHTTCCRSGRGGDGEIAAEGQGRWVDNHKYRHNSGLKKRIWLPASEPADGQNGSDVVIIADPSVRTCSPELTDHAAPQHFLHHLHNEHNEYP